MKNLIIYLLLFTAFTAFCAAESQAQRKEWNIAVFAEPSDYYKVKINGETQPTGFAFEVEPGQIHLEVWAPHHEVFDTTFTYISGKITIYKRLKPTAELREYKIITAEQNNLRRQTYLTIGLAGAAAIGAVANYGQVGRNRHVFRRQELGNRYDLPTYNQEALDDAESTLRRSRYLQYGLYAATAGFTAWGISKLLKIKKINPPELKEDKSFVLDDFGILPGIHGGGMHGFLRIKF